MRRLLITIVFVLVAAPLFAQTNITVLGVGKLAWDQATLTPTQASAQTYYAYVPSTATTKITLTATCVAATAPATGSACTAPLSQLNLQTGQTVSLALTSAVTAADGEQETAKVVAPFTLSKAGPAASPVFSATPIRPATP